MKTQSATKTAKKQKTRKTKARGLGQKPQAKHHLNLQDQFTKETKDQDRQHLLEEHQLKLQARNQLHQARISSLLTQLNTQLYKIWNEAWLQRQKSMDQGFKEWLKVLMA